MKTKNITFSLPIDIVELLQAFVEKQKMSQFAAQALRNALIEKKESLKAEYKEANKDPDRLKTIDEWRHLDIAGWE